MGFQNNTKRKIELLGMALKNAELYRDVDFGLIFKRDIPTIKRDLKELRGEGIDIHSKKKSGIVVEGQLPASLLKSLIAQYTGICNAGAGMDKATALLVKKQKDMALHHIVTIQRGIEGATCVVIDYEKEAGEIEKGREVGPVALYSNDGYWRLLARHDRKMKQFHLIKMLAVRPTRTRFTPIPREEIDAMFRNSFRAWTGTEKFRIRVHLDATWAERLRPQQLLESQVITENLDGSLILEATVNSLDEFASWVVSRGKGVTVLSPDPLKHKVIDLARGALSNYPKSAREPARTTRGAR
jgi:predicted DNA-binding transcriptional regulator YafY